MTLSPRQRRWLYGTSLVVFLSGALWCLKRRAWLLALHGGAAMVFLIVFGTLLPTHLKKGIAAGRHLRSGWSLTGLVAVLIVTGYALYYTGSETLRHASSLLHIGLGLASPLVLALHVHTRRKRNVR